MNESASGLARCVVVGYDGSQHARNALAHAVERVSPGGKLLAVYGYGGEALGRETLERMRAECADLLAGTEYDTKLLPEPPASALVDAARTHDADEIVVGTRGFGDTRTWLGSVSHELLRISDRPVVVIPPAERSISRDAP